MTNVAPNAVPPGWYADPMTAGHARWWSGQDWTHHVQPVPTGAPLEQPGNLLVPGRSSMGTRALVWGIVSLLCNAILAPSILAIVYGAIALNDAKRLEARGLPTPQRSRARAGIVLGIVGAVVTIVIVVGFKIWMASSR